MIRLENLTKSFWVKGEHKIVIDNLSLTLPSGKSLALLGRNGAGKSTLLDIIAGTLHADSGRVLSDGTISWPVGLAASFQGDLTGAENVRFIARIYGVDTDDLVDEVTAVGDRAFRKKSQQIFAERMQSSSAILVNHTMAEVRKFCNAGVVLEGGKAEYFEDLEEAIALHDKILG